MVFLLQRLDTTGEPCAARASVERTAGQTATRMRMESLGELREHWSAATAWLPPAGERATMTHPLTDSAVAVAAVQAGAAVVRARFGTALERLDKGGGDFATGADL